VTTKSTQNHEFVVRSIRETRALYIGLGGAPDKWIGEALRGVMKRGNRKGRAEDGEGGGGKGTRTEGKGGMGKRQFLSLRRL